MKATIATERHRLARRNCPRRFVDGRGLDKTWQADLVDITAYSSHNKGYKYLLTIIDIFSKYACAVPIKSKSGKDVTTAMKFVLTQNRIPKHLHVDQGREFNINMYSTFSNLRASICDIALKPVDVSTVNEKQLYRSIYKPRQIKRSNRKRKFKVGDRARISKYKNVFEKGYAPNWTSEIFTVSEVKNTNPPTYKLTDYQDQSIEEGFYEEELN
ncbi:uncharacterized protein LOC124413337 [Diprion similis]|uniref:uncharacterized protein LOC124413337 n=1 Tax=Diprion similis TaxID=362088 RepID=UPI001EF8BAF5|nr:uncharacterized protein LOC124413337 [Diprion similis]